MCELVRVLRLRCLVRLYQGHYSLLSFNLPHQPVRWVEAATEVRVGMGSQVQATTSGGRVLTS